MPLDRVDNWKRFSRHMEQYIFEKTVAKYTSGDEEGTDLMAITQSPMVCVWNILKYAWRIWQNRMKENDLEKIAHYAEMAYNLSKGQVIRIEKGENPRIKVVAGRNGLEYHDRLRA